MGKLIKIAFTIGFVIIATLLLSASFIFLDMAYSKEKQLQNLYARKDDLILQGQRIDEIIQNLNQTIITEQSTHAEINSKIEELSKKQGAITIDTQTVTPTEQPQLPEPKPKPVVVTRAS